MKFEKTIVTFAFALGIGGILLMLFHRPFLGSLCLFVTAVILWTRGNAGPNDINQAEKTVKTNGVSIMDVFEAVKDLETPLGKAWIGNHIGYPDESIIFGPSRFHDLITISKDDKKDEYIIRHINKLENISAWDDEGKNKINSVPAICEIEVNPRNFAEFSAYKIAACDMVTYLEKKVKAAVGLASEPEETCTPEFNLFYYNNKEGYVRDGNKNAYMTLKYSHSPFEAKVCDADGAELTNILPNAVNRNGQAVDVAGFEIVADGEHYADVVRLGRGKRDSFEIITDEGTYVATVYETVHRANVKCNYRICRDGELKAIVAANPRVEFRGIGVSNEYVIMSYDDDLLVLYATTINFIIALNNFMK